MVDTEISGKQRKLKGANTFLLKTAGPGELKTSGGARLTC